MINLKLISYLEYIVPEVHYDNPNKNIGYIENIIVRYYLTKKLFANELGVLSIGSETGPFALDLPPNAAHIGVNSFCHNDCIKTVIFGLFVLF